ncbi:OmpA family protein, partial [candidate division KSB1 bacterium]|nr:OmpA family protein [candidate division KSB1 bacterium]
TDQVREIAKEAKYEAKHAAYLSMKIRQTEDSKATMEVIALEAEAPLQHIGDKLETAVAFDQGIKPAEDEILHKIWVLQQTIASQNQDIEDKEAQITLLTQQIQNMESQLGDLKDKEQNLAALMNKQKLAREKYDKVEKSFTVAEAQVLRMGEQVIIRLYGLSFDVGKSTIDPKNFGLLSKVVDAFNLYPSCGVTVEGHTDSYGTDDANQKLSTERSSAVQKYLVAASGIGESRIMAVGYGESKPVASNETKDGRRKNRRIDIVIHPKE